MPASKPPEVADEKCRDTGELPARFVIVAEDDLEMRSMLASVLTKRGFHVVQAADGVELMERIRSAARDPAAGSFELVITDVQMPGMTGLQALEKIRTESPDLPVIVITAFGDFETHRKAGVLGAAAVFDKPFELEELLAAVAEHI